LKKKTSKNLSTTNQQVLKECKAIAVQSGDEAAVVDSESNGAVTLPLVGSVPALAAAPAELVAAATSA